MKKIRAILINAAAITAIAAAAVTITTPDGPDRYATALAAHTKPACGLC